jgi:hypothetical protein
MKKTFACVLSACVLLAGGAVMQRASAQEATQYPGQPTRANVWIQNRGEAEAIPVSIEKVLSGVPLRVEVTGEPMVTMDPRTVLQVRAGRQSWGYRAVTVAAGQDAVAVLNGAGADGWETTGVALPSAGGTVIFLKRPN